MKIALDFDKTFTADPRLWNSFINMAVASGHEVRIVTMRCDIKDGINWKVATPDAVWHVPPVPVIWCDGNPKAEFCRALGWVPDIWIDDDPYGILKPSRWRDQDPELVAWRVTDPYKNPKQPAPIKPGLQSRKQTNG